MSRTFKRPMFRKGGNVGVGIMSGITDRVQARDGFAGEEFSSPLYSRQLTELQANKPIDTTIRPFAPMVYENIDIEEMVGTPKTTEEYIAELEKGAGKYGGADPLTTFLLTAGPQVAKATGFADAISKLGPANKALLERLDKEAEYQRDLRLAGTKLGIGAEERAEQKTFDLKKLDLSQENEVKYLNDQRRYDQLVAEDKRNYDEAVRVKTRAYQKLDNEDKQKFEQKLIDEGRAFELEKIKREEEFQLKLLEDQTGVSNTIKESAQKGYENRDYGTLGEATRIETWKLKDSRELLDKGFSIASEPLDPKAVQNEKSLKKAAQNFGKKGNNTNRIYYDWTNDIQYKLVKDGKEYKFEVYDQGTETSGDMTKTTESVKEAIEKLPIRSEEEIGEDESYDVVKFNDPFKKEFGDRFRREQRDAIRKANVAARGTVLPQAQGKKDVTLDTRMTRPQQSDYEKFLREYRNRT